MVPGRERAALVAVGTGKRRAQLEGQLQELTGLAEAAGATVALTLVQDRARLDPATLIGTGKVEHLAAACAEADIDLVIFDNELSPAQLRNLERLLDRRVVDRTQVILDIFARRARTREGKLQVELAQLEYLLPRLVGSSAALSRLGGGIGTRGPGETKLETDRRKIRLRIKALGEAIAEVRSRRARLRARRRRGPRPAVALVGYTNAGKTTLFNQLTRDDAAASNALFVTLDPLTREVRLPDRQAVLLSDTVGFIERLPHTLVAAFRATLEEVAEADLLLHVIDASSPERERHERAVRDVLAEVGASDVPVLDVYNKCDRVELTELSRLRGRHPNAAFISALRGTGTPALMRAMQSALALDTRRITLELDTESASAREIISRIYRLAQVIRHSTDGSRVSIEADVPRRLVPRFQGVIAG
jgi:GTPase